MYERSIKMINKVKAAMNSNAFYNVDERGLLTIRDKLRAAVEDGDYDNQPLPPIPEGVLSLSRVFTGWSRVRYLDLTSWDTSEVRDMSNMFSNATKLRTVDLLSWDTSKVRYMSCMFAKCRDLEELNVSNFDTVRADEMDCMFLGCETLKSLDVHNFDISRDTDIRSMFRGCTRLESLYIDIPELMSEHFEDDTLYDVFLECDALNISLLPDWMENTILNVRSEREERDRLAEEKRIEDERLAEEERAKKERIAEEKRVEEERIADAKKKPYIIQGDCLHLKSAFRELLASGHYGAKPLPPIPSSVTSLKGLFAAVSTVTVLNFDGWEIANITECKDMFEGCTALEVIQLPDLINKAVARGAAHIGLAKPSGATLGIRTDEMITMYKKAAREVEAEIYYKVEDGQLSPTPALVEYLNNGNNALVNIPPSATSADRLFAGMSGIKQLSLRKWDISNLKSMDSMFEGCDALELIALPTPTSTRTATLLAKVYSQKPQRKFRMGHYNDLEKKLFVSALSDLLIEEKKEEKRKACNRPESVPTPPTSKEEESEYYDVREGRLILKSSFEAMLNEGLYNGKPLPPIPSSVTSLRYLFRKCSDVVTLDLSEWDTSNITDMGSMLDGCGKLREINTSNFNTSSVKCTTYMFYNTAIERLDLRNFDMSNVEDAMMMLHTNSSLKELLPFHLTTQKVADSLKEMTKTINKETVWEYSHWSDEELIRFFGYIKVPHPSPKPAVLSSPPPADSGLPPIYTVEGRKVKLTGTGKSLLKDGFFNDKRLPPLPEGVTDISGMFQYCEGVTHLDLSCWDTSSVKEMSSLFSGCTDLEYVNLSSFHTPKLENMTNLFRRCTSLKEVDITTFDTSKVRFTASMFQHCESLTSIDLSRLVTENVIHMSDMFKGCSGLTTLDLSSFDLTKVKDKASNMLDCCTSLKTVIAYRTPSLESAKCFVSMYLTAPGGIEWDRSYCTAEEKASYRKFHEEAIAEMKG